MNTESAAEQFGRAIRLAEEFNKALAPLTTSERLSAIREASKDYCPYCGIQDPCGDCPCWNDD